MFITQQCSKRIPFLCVPAYLCKLFCCLLRTHTLRRICKKVSCAGCELNEHNMFQILNENSIFHSIYTQPEFQGVQPVIINNLSMFFYYSKNHYTRQAKLFFQMIDIMNTMGSFYPTYCVKMKFLIISNAVRSNEIRLNIASQFGLQPSKKNRRQLTMHEIMDDISLHFLHYIKAKGIWQSVLRYININVSKV